MGLYSILIGDALQEAFPEGLLAFQKGPCASDNGLFDRSQAVVGVWGGLAYPGLAEKRSQAC